MRTIDLGCGTAYWSAWLARLGAHPIGIDNSRRQLETARVLQREHRIAFPLIHASAEEVPLRADSFDLALSEYGASIWCEPERWVAEAARVLRPGGLLIFLRNASLLMLCIPDSQGEPATDRLLRPYFGTHRIEWSGSDEVEFQPTHGEWIRLLRSCGFVIENLIEIQAPEGARAPFPYVSGDWARQWPSEEIWVARKAGR